jgi:hypothetical protein
MLAEVTIVVGHEGIGRVVRGGPRREARPQLAYLTRPSRGAPGYRSARSVCSSFASIVPGPDAHTMAGPQGGAKTKNWTGQAGRRRRQSDQHEGLQSVLPDRHGLRDLRRALDAPDLERAAVRSPPVQRDPARHARDLEDTARPAAAGAGSRRHHAQGVERGDAYASDTAALRAGSGSVIADVRHGARASPAATAGQAQEPSGRRYGMGTYSTDGRVRVGCGKRRMSSYTSAGISVVTGRPSDLASSAVMA